MIICANSADEQCFSLVDWVRRSKIKVKPFGDRREFNDMRKQFGVGVISSRKGLPIDVWWMEASEALPGTLDRDVINEEDMFIQLYEKLLYARSQISAARESEGLLDSICHEYIYDPETSIEDATLYYVDKVLKESGYDRKLLLKTSEIYTLIMHRNCVICGLAYGKDSKVNAIIFMGLSASTRKKITTHPFGRIEEISKYKENIIHQITFIEAWLCGSAV